MLTLLLLAIAFATGATVAPAAAQTYPTRPINMIVPYPAGGVTDGLARLVAEHMKTSLGQPVIVENVGGAGGSIGAGRVARAAPDGYTLLLGNAETHVFNAAAQTLQYDVVKDFEPIALMPTYPFILVTSNDVPAKNLRELVDWIKANPGQGLAGHGRRRDGAASVRSVHAGHDGRAMAARAVSRRHARDAGSVGRPDQPDVHRLGQLLAADPQQPDLAPTPSRPKSASPARPSIPTVDEAGLPGLYVSVWNAFYVPKGTPKEAIDRLNAAANAALADPTILRRVTVDMGLDMPAANMRTPEALGALQKAEIEKWWPIVKAANVKAQ